ncbi:uncharacterized protein [Venturia canescens]|uniref:uncharacterized protein n=1 Tax=Venturia canescens TaxID=32260 RepID=UPI001C9BBE78|nr:uncharacterized protein LOC122417786 [Venturia canescens]
MAGIHQDPKEIYELEEPSKCLSFLRLLWKFCRCIFSHVTLVSLVVAYCVLGAYAFESIEAEHEIQVKESIKYVRSNVTKRIWLLTENFEVLIQENWTDKVVKELVKFEADLLDKMKKEGWDGSEELKNIQWTFAGALFYSIIVITTIGYGHIAPKTHNGKVVTIFYAILGIPLMLLCLSNIGKVMASSFRFLYWKICCYVCTRPPKPRHRHRHRNVFLRSQSLRQPGRYAAARLPNAGPSSASFRRPMRAVSQRSADSGPPFSSYTESFARSARPSSGSRTDRGRCEASPRLAPSQRFTSPVNDTIDRAPIPGAMAHAPSKNRPENVAIASPGTIRIGPRYPAGTRSLDRKCRPITSNNDANRTPVLFNKYAMDEPLVEDRRFLSPGDEAATRRCRSVEASVDLEMLRSANLRRSVRNNNARGWSNRRDPSSGGRLMSPIDLAVPRRVYVDNLDLEYDYLTSAGLGSGDHEPDDPTMIKPVPIWLCVFLVVSYILGGAFLFAEWETWPYLDSAYFCFITLTTIGFGDLVPAHRLNAHQGIALCSLYLLFGIALLVMSFNLVQEEVISSVKSVAKRLGIIKDEDQSGGPIDEEEVYDVDVYDDAYPAFDREPRRCYDSEFDRTTDNYYHDDFPSEAASRRRDIHQRDRSPMPSRYALR